MSHSKTSRGKSSRPQNHTSRVEGTAERPTRTPVGTSRDILTVQGKDPDYHYRWVKDAHEAGQRILRYLEALYEFVKYADVEGVGENSVFTSENVGSIVRKPAGKDGEYLYLMRIKLEYYEEDQCLKQDEIDEQEATMIAELEAKTDGRYGKFDLSEE